MAADRSAGPARLGACCMGASRAPPCPPPGRRPVGRLIDLTYAAGRLWTNLYRTPFITAIHRRTGQVTDMLDPPA